MKRLEALALEDRLDEILLYDEDGMFGTDGSYECLMNVFENAWDKADAIAREAIGILKGLD